MNVRHAALLDKLRRVCACGHVHYATRCHVCKTLADGWIEPLGIGAADQFPPPVRPEAPSTRLDRRQQFSAEVGIVCVLIAAGIVGVAMLQQLVQRFA